MAIDTAPFPTRRAFEDRADAGRAVAALLGKYSGRKDVTVLALPRGGVPVAYEVARALGAELDVLVVRKLGVPMHPELAMGAIASGGGICLNEDVVRMAGISDEQIKSVIAMEQNELRRREQAYRGNRLPLDVHERVVIVVDDGMATGASMQVAASALRNLRPARIVSAVPVAPADSAERLGDVVDEFVCVYSPMDFQAVGQFYRSFGQTTDSEVCDLLGRSSSRSA